ncbi:MULTISPECIES: hypothetical protein [Rhodomicrobium]|uniref:hypothetical protein n=1 Tax=Rhodomicrobium TaxID=1068 RepID=UPI000B4B144C|nr:MULTISPECIES: hypothetical protein [Rhodomicrobium]
MLLAVSAAMNWQFGYSLGKTQFDSHVFGAASIAADGLKALLPFFIFAAWRNRNWSQALGGAALWAVCILYALTSALGFAALNRSDTTGGRTIQAEKYEDLRGQLHQITQQQAWLDKHRSVGMVEAEIDAAKQNVRWTTSEACVNATVKESREFCESYHKLQAELAAAKKDDVLQKQAEEIRGKLGTMDGRAAVKVADPQAAIISTLSGLDIAHVEVALTILVTLLVELGSSLGLYVSTSTWRINEGPRRPLPEPVKVVEIIPPAYQLPQQHQPQQQPAQLGAPKSDIEAYFGDRIRQDDGASVTALALYDNYCEWCEQSGRQPVGLPIFSRQLTDLGVQKAKIAGKIRYIGIRMTGSGDEEEGSEVAAIG